MAKYKKVKRYHRSFYSPGMWVKKAVGIIVLVAVVLVVGWLAAPHVLDWATHTWYTVVRNRDLSASSETTASSAAASSEVTAEPAASSEVRADRSRIGTGCTRRRHHRGQLGRSGHGCGKGRSFPACRRPAAGPAGRGLRRRHPEGQCRKYPVSLSGGCCGRQHRGGVP